MNGKDAFDIAGAKMTIDCEIMKLNELKEHINGIIKDLNVASQTVTGLCDRILEEVKQK